MMQGQVHCYARQCHNFFFCLDFLLLGSLDYAKKER